MSLKERSERIIQRKEKRGTFLKCRERPLRTQVAQHKRLTETVERSDPSQKKSKVNGTFPGDMNPKKLPDLSFKGGTRHIQGKKI